jgi:dimethylhistidine N-methyltransferase
LPIDIAGEFLQHTVTRFRGRFATLETRAITADFTEDFALPEWVPRNRRVAFFPGSTMGNLSAGEAAAFLQRMRHHVGAEGRALIGLDLCKTVGRLIPAYDDAAGTTARFNLNLLTRINRELGGDFVLDRFAHHARWNQEEAAVEMHLVSLTEQIATVSGVEFELAPGETIHTESSRKYDVAKFTALAAEQGWRVARLWTDEEHLFGLFGLVSL